MDIREFLKIRKDILNKENIFTLIFSLFCTIIVFMAGSYFSYILNLGKVISEKIHINNFGIFFFPALVLFFIIFYFIGTKLARVIILLPSGSNNLYILRNEDITIRQLARDFIFQGVLRDNYDDEKCLYLNQSSEGMISKKFFFKFHMEFYARLLYHSFGIITHAKNLENYFMLRINFDENKGIYITPHIRKNGLWEIQDLREELDNGTQIDNDQKFIFKLDVNGREIKLLIRDRNDKKTIRDFYYLLPDYFPLLPEVNNQNQSPSNIVTELEWLTAGRIGFRAFGMNEKAIVYNIKISKLASD